MRQESFCGKIKQACTINRNKHAQPLRKDLQDAVISALIYRKCLYLSLLQIIERERLFPFTKFLSHFPFCFIIIGNINIVPSDLLENSCKAARNLISHDGFKVRFLKCFPVVEILILFTVLYHLLNYYNDSANILSTCRVFVQMDIPQSVFHQLVVPWILHEKKKKKNT